LRGGRVRLAVPQRGDKKRLVDRIAAAGREGARPRAGRKRPPAAVSRRGCPAACGGEGPLARIEVYDNSHIQGSHAVGAMIVAGPDGLMKNAYRKFTIRGLRPAKAENAAQPEAPPPALPRLRGRELPELAAAHRRRSIEPPLPQAGE